MRPDNRPLRLRIVSNGEPAAHDLRPFRKNCRQCGAFHPGHEFHPVLMVMIVRRIQAGDTGRCEAGRVPCRSVRFRFGFAKSGRMGMTKFILRASFRKF